MALTETKIRAARPADKDQWFNDGRGLYLRIRCGGSKTWVVRRKILGKTEIIKLGDYPALSLKQARLDAAQYQLRQDISTATVEELAKKYMLEVVERSHRRPGMVQGYLDRAVLQKIGRRKVRDVTRAELVSIVQEYRARGERAADSLRSVLKALFGYALELGYREDNPMLGVTRRVSGYTATSRERVLTDHELGLIWREKHDNARLLRFLLLTGVRIGEAQKGAPWLTEGRFWTIPAALAKNKRPHWVYLTDSARDQLTARFEVSATAVQAWLRRWCERHQITPAFTPHDARRTFVTRLNEIGIPPHIAEKLVGHTLQGVLAVYNRAEYEAERIEATKAIERHLLDVVA